jgi:hypothetical protein
MRQRLTRQEASDVYDILIAECGAPMSERPFFIASIMEDRSIHEWRFCGNMGYGGKFKLNNGQAYVTFYPEDTTPERQQIRVKVDGMLDTLLKEG